ncbi:uncharacterized protein LOC113216551 [Frankliniella occidentalis]|uniref:Uncharacterized protein LOC113216551 n=1 Tax=Frankliniella occidentalis TaxID=133901 RepID=A0A6J1TH66_FRAOC|nr:uncharacterized protein LOC113216551 [Frankliniella occidentalis]
MARQPDVLSRSILHSKLLLSAYKGCLEEVKRTIEGANNVDLKFADSNGNTVLHWACQGGSEDVVKYLLSLPSIDLFKENRDMETALDVLHKNNLNMECMEEALLSHAVEVRNEFAPKMREKTSTRNVFDETCAMPAMKQYCPYSLHDVQTVLIFLCPPSTACQVNNISCATKFPLSEFEFGLLYHTASRDTFFEMNSVITVRENVEIIETEVGSSDAVTEALFKVRNVIQRLRDERFKKDAIQDIVRSVFAQQLNVEQLEKEQMFLAAMINEKQATNEKIEKYLNFVDDVKNKHATSSTKCAVCLIYFVELFACDDTFPEGKNIRLPKSEKRLLKELKKKYYIRHYPEMGLMKDITCIRTQLVHKQSKSRGLLKPSQLFEASSENYHCPSKSECLAFMHTFTEYVSKSMLHERQNSCTSFFKKHGQKENVFKNLSNNVEEHLKKTKKTDADMLVYFCKKANDFLKNVRDEVLYELLFELIVNVGPQLGEYQMLSELRNTIVHGFHDETVSGLRKKLPQVMRKLYIHHLAERVGNELLKMRDERENCELNTTFSKELEKLNENFKHWQSSGGSFQGLKWWDDDSLESNIQLYVMCLSDVLDCPGNDSDNILKLDSRRVVGGDHVHLKVIFENILFLRRSHLKDQNMPNLEQSLIKELCTQFSLTMTEAGKVIGRIKNEKITENKENENFCKEVTDIIRSLRILKHPYSVSTRTFTDGDVFSLFNAVMKGGNINELRSYLTSYNLTEREKDTVTDVLFKVYTQMQEKVVLFSGEVVVVSVSSVVSHLLGLIKNMEPVKCKLDDLSTAFRDQLFLESLSKMLHYVPKEQNCPKELIEFRLYKVIRDVHSLDYAAPLIARILAEERDTVVECKTVETIIAVFLKTEDTISLTNLLSTNSKMRTGALVKTISEQNCSRELLAKVIKCICPDKISFFFESIIDNRTVENVLAASNNVIFDLLGDKEFERCSKVIECATQLELKVPQTNKSLSLDRDLLHANYFHVRGLRTEKDGNTVSVTGSETNKGLFHKAKEVLERVRKASSDYPLQHMLSISKLGYINYLLGKNKMKKNKKKEHYVKARNYAEELFGVLLKYLWPSNKHDDDDPNIFTKYNALLGLAESSQKYQRLLELGKDYEENLNISRVYRDYLFYKLLSLGQEKTTSEERRKLIKEYNTLNKQWEHRVPFPFSEIYFLKRKIQIFERSNSESDMIKTIELKVKCLKVVGDRLGSCSSTAAEMFDSLENDLKNTTRKAAIESIMVKSAKPFRTVC